MGSNRFSHEKKKTKNKEGPRRKRVELCFAVRSAARETRRNDWGEETLLLVRTGHRPPPPHLPHVPFYRTLMLAAHFILSQPTTPKDESEKMLEVCWLAANKSEILPTDNFYENIDLFIVCLYLF